MYQKQKLDISIARPWSWSWLTVNSINERNDSRGEICCYVNFHEKVNFRNKVNFHRIDLRIKNGVALQTLADS